MKMQDKYTIQSIMFEGTCLDCPYWTDMGPNAGCRASFGVSCTEWDDGYEYGMEVTWKENLSPIELLEMELDGYY